MCFEGVGKFIRELLCGPQKSARLYDLPTTIKKIYVLFFEKMFCSLCSLFFLWKNVLLLITVRSFLFHALSPFLKIFCIFYICIFLAIWLLTLSYGICKCNSKGSVLGIHVFLLIRPGWTIPFLVIGVVWYSIGVTNYLLIGRALRSNRCVTRRRPCDENHVVRFRQSAENRSWARNTQPSRGISDELARGCKHWHPLAPGRRYGKKSILLVYVSPPISHTPQKHRPFWE